MHITHIKQIDFKRKEMYYTVRTKDGDYLCTLDNPVDAELLAEDCGGSIFTWCPWGWNYVSLKGVLFNEQQK